MASDNGSAPVLDQEKPSVQDAPSPKATLPLESIVREGTDTASPQANGHHDPAGSSPEETHESSSRSPGTTSPPPVTSTRPLASFSPVTALSPPSNGFASPPQSPPPQSPPPADEDEPERPQQRKHANDDIWEKKYVLDEPVALDC